MSTVPSVNSWTSADVDAKLKDSAKLLSEWARLLDKAEKVASPNDIPKADVEQHIRLKRKLNESLGMLAKIAQSHTNRAKHSRIDNKSSSSSAGKVSTDPQTGNKMIPSNPSQTAVGLVPRPMVSAVSSQQGVPMVPQQVSGMNQAPIGAQSGMYSASLSNPAGQRMPNAPMPMFNNVNQAGQIRIAPNGAPLPNGTNPNTLSANLLNNRAYPQQQQYPQGVGQAGMMGYHNMMQNQQQAIPGQHMHGVPYQPQQQMNVVQPQPGTMNGVPISNTQPMQQVQAPNQTMVQPPQQQQYPPNFYAAQSSNVGFQQLHNQGSMMTQNAPQKLGAPMGLNYPATFPPQGQQYQPPPGQMSQPHQQSLSYPNTAFNPASHQTMYQMHTQSMNQSHLPLQVQQQQQQMMLQQQQQQHAMTHHRPSSTTNSTLPTQSINAKVPTGQQMYSMPQNSNVQLMPQNILSQPYPNMPNQFSNQFPGQYITQQNVPTANQMQPLTNVPQPTAQHMQQGNVAGGVPTKLGSSNSIALSGSNQQPPSEETS